MPTWVVWLAIGLICGGVFGVVPKSTDATPEAELRNPSAVVATSAGIWIATSPTPVNPVTVTV